MNLSNPSIKAGGTDRDFALYEFGVAIKYRAVLPADMNLKFGLGIGYRVMTSDYYNDNIEGLGINLSAELQFASNVTIRPFIEFGFSTQPVGGNNLVDVKWGSLFYLAGGIVF